MTKKSIWVGIIVLAFIFMISSCTAGILSISDQTLIEGNVLQIPIKGVIVGDSSTGLFTVYEASSQEIVSTLEQAGENNRVKGIILEINSPGGSPVASEEIANAIKELDKPVVAWIRETGASGAYWIASACDYIVASRMSVTGSIGVYGSYLEYPELLHRFNISYNRIVSGEYKDTGIPYRELESEEEMLIQARIDRLHEFFVEEVSENRNLDKDNVDELASGIWYLGVDAVELGLVDELGSKDEAIDYLEEELGENVTVSIHKKEPSIWDVLAEINSESAFNLGRGMTYFIARDMGRIRLTI